MKNHLNVVLAAAAIAGNAAGILRGELDRWGKVVREAKIKAD